MSAPDSPRPATPHLMVRAIEIPDPGPRPRRFKPIAPQVEVSVSPAGALPFRAVLPAAEATPERLQALAGQAAPLRPLTFGAGQGAIDITLKSARGVTLRAGSLILSRKGSASIQVPIDPATRRFRASNIPTGRWEVRATAAGHGRGRQTIAVREQDAMRGVLRLDGKSGGGKVRFRFQVGGPARRIRVVARDRSNGQVVLDRWVPVAKGGVTLAAVPQGALHFEFMDTDGGSCYDADVNDITAAGVHEVAIVPSWQLPVPEPDPPAWLALSEDLDNVARLLPVLGIQSVEQLAASRYESLMHLMLEHGTVPVHTRHLQAAIEGAKQQLGITATTGATRIRLRLNTKGEMARKFRLAAPGTVELDVDLGSGGRGRLEVDGAWRKRTFPVNGRRTIALTVKDRQWSTEPVLRLRLINQTGRRIEGALEARLPEIARLDHELAPVSTRGRIENILAALAPHNPGLAVTVPLSVLTPENIRGWLDRARTVMRQLGICSLNDLGTLRIDPNRVLERGAYVAPAKPPSDGSVLALEHYRFESVIGGSVLHYLPNDTIDEWAVIVGGLWDIRGHTVVIGKDVRELFVVVGKVLYDNQTTITWEQPDLPPASTYWPDAAPGTSPGTFGAHGGDGGDGDPNPHVSHNGGADASISAPKVTMYVLDATNNLPPILLIGQRGGQGGRGQNGGRGGDGFEGAPADGTWYGSCTRGVGYGGDGGPGGDGGKGGRGGRGGRGGEITVLTTGAGINVMSVDPPLIFCYPGAGGLPGVPGAAGAGGLGGAAGCADCVPCDDHPERHGRDGAGGDHGEFGETGSSGPPMHSDAIQFLPITREEWEQAFNNPHILQIEPNRAEVGDTVTLTGANFDPAIDRVFFDGHPVGQVLSDSMARFAVPSAEGTYHGVVIRPDVASDRVSNTVMLLVLPTLDDIPPLTRWEEGQTVEVTGKGFMGGCKLTVEDWSADPVTSFNLVVDAWAPALLRTTIPDGPLGNLRGVRRLRVRNPSGATTQQETVVRIGHQIIVKCAAFRLVGQESGVTTAQSKAQITSLFVEGGINALTHFWDAAGIAFQLVAQVQDVLVDDEIAECFPQDDEDNEEEDAAFAAVAAAAPFVAGAINMVFCNDVEGAGIVGFSHYGGGPAVLGELGDELAPFFRMKLASHELGHALCLTHACDGEGLPDCGSWHMTRLMYPTLFDVVGEQSTLGELTTGEIERARRTATHFERGKTSLLPVTTASSDDPPLCKAGDEAN